MIKKICMGLIIGLVAVDLFCFGKVFLNLKRPKVASTDEIVQNIEHQEKLAENETIAEESISEDSQNITTEQIAEIPETTETPKANEQQEIKQQPVQETKQATTNTTKTQTNKTTQNTKPQVQENKPTTTQTQVQVQPEQPKVEENKQETKPVEISKEPVEKYVKNDAMIKKIKDVIENNQSDYMKQYGYQVVVDSSIKEHCNQFTFTETRVKAYITYAFGTIRIYAEDYYKDGNLIMTECYIQ